MVFEGGNHAHDGVNPSQAINDLQLISTYYRPNNRLFHNFGDTSASTALALKMAAEIMAARPEIMPQTVRGLMVHSAEWTPPMSAKIDAAACQEQKLALLRRYGWGVPNLSRALKSASDDATMIVEDALTPFYKDGTAIKTRDMHLHALPWPQDEFASSRSGRRDACEALVLCLAQSRPARVDQAASLHLARPSL